MHVQTPPRIGIDLVEVDRMAKLESTPGLAEQLFTYGEIAYCQAHRFPRISFAACFAAKEAFLKASGIGLHAGMTFSEIEIEYTHPHQPTLTLHGRLRERFADTFACHLSVGTCHDMASAVVALEEKRNH